MSKRKADSFSQLSSESGSKKFKQNITKNSPAQSKSTVLLGSDSEDSGDDSADGGASLTEGGFKINEEYAKRFEHNKKREELHRRKYFNSVLILL